MTLGQILLLIGWLLMCINALGSKPTENVGVVSALLAVSMTILFVGLRL